jgi:hypothetical protein
MQGITENIPMFIGALTFSMVDSIAIALSKKHYSLASFL